MSNVNFVEPEAYLIGYTRFNIVNIAGGLLEFLEDTGNEGFFRETDDKIDDFCGKSGAYSMPAMYAKLCYLSLTPGNNLNISKTRSIQDTFKACINNGHGSVLEHFSFNFMFTNVSRVLTHELVRHRVGVAYSQESGRYVRKDSLDFVLPPELMGHKEKVEQALNTIWEQYQQLSELVGIDNDNVSFNEKKQLTSALRRVLPNGMANAIGVTLNLRSLRHIIEMRTNRAAEWEIRLLFNKVADTINKNFPLALYGGSTEMVNGLNEWTNLKV